MADLSISFKKTAALIEKNAFTQKTTIGIGFGSSATKGAPIVIQWATKLTTPNTVATNYVGNSLATDTYPILKHIDPPTLMKQTITGMTQVSVVL